MQKSKNNFQIDNPSPNLLHAVLDVEIGEDDGSKLDAVLRTEARKNADLRAYLRRIEQTDAAIIPALVSSNGARGYVIVFDA